jgi:hypothetical protein
VSGFAIIITDVHIAAWGLGLPAKGLEEVSPQGTKSFGDIVSGVFAPVLAKHTKSFNLADTLSVGVDRIQRNFEPMQRQVESWR